MVDWSEGRYEVSSYGRVRSWAVRGATAHRRKWSVILKRKPRSSGYIWHNLRAPDGIITVAAHALVLAAFVGPRPEGFEAAHLDGKRDNNVISNLKWVTKKENAAHRVLHGTDPIGSRNPRAKIPEGMVPVIRNATFKYGGIRGLAKKLGVSEGTIHRLRRRITWAHV